MQAFRVLLCILMLSTVKRSDAIIASFFIKKHITLHAYLFKGEKKQKVMQWTLASDKKFSLSFLHSVTLTPVLSTYRIQDTHIIQTQEQFLTHGYGLPSQQNENAFERWEEKDDAFIVHMNRKIAPLVVRVSMKYKTTLLIDGVAYSLGKYDGKSLLFIAE